MQRLRTHIPGPALLAIFALVTVLGADRLDRASADEAPDDYQQEIESWRERRVQSLTGENGWLALVGLTWLEEGANSIGGAPDSVVPLPSDKAPETVGTIFVEGSEARIEISPEVTVLSENRPVHSMELATDAEGAPTTLVLDDLTFYLINRDGRLGVRTKDRNSPARDGFRGIESWPIDAAWRLEARLEPHDPPKSVPIPTVLGTISDQPSPGSVVFEYEGEVYRIDALGQESAEELFLIFADATTGRETYGGGRYLYAPVDAEGRVDLDFNKSYNPPCAFTAFATCPLPPRQNRLALGIEAGEKTYTGEH